ncbi:uncharacterized protein LOC106648429 [Trichogramma pretiosum]|uniref:Large ribosomal subunit protein bL27m n=1 Tax=Trichogramma kaykai TaxID=54128 RepID=A0ABD2WWB1_9HYME|nr:uncharacterized protein LOC106648429 [Trichogramma pretiosum]
MATLANLAWKCFETPQSKTIPSCIKVCSRNAAKKTSGTTSNAGNSKPKHRGWKRQDGSVVTVGTSLATQNCTRWHPGLNVGFGRNGTLYAMVPGKVVVTCEKFEPKWDHTWVERHYEGRENQPLYKKYFNVIPKPQHNRFKLVNKI